MTVCEILSIAQRQGYSADKRKTLDDMLRELIVVDVRRPIADCYAVLLPTLQAAGTPIGENDTWIAATAQATGAVLLTGDQHFGMIPPGLIIGQLPSWPP